MITLKNPLTLEERLEAARLLSREASGYLENLSRFSLSEMEEQAAEKAETDVFRSSLLLASVKMLASESYNLFQFTAGDFRVLIGYLPHPETAKARRIEGYIGIKEPLVTAHEILFPAVSCLVKNCFETNYASRVFVNVSPFTGTVDNLVFLPDGASKKGDYVRISVHDNGRGVPPVLDSIPYLRLAKLSAKALRMPIAIDSKTGNTTVSLYHPVF